MLNQCILSLLFWPVFLHIGGRVWNHAAVQEVSERNHRFDIFISGQSKVFSFFLLSISCLVFCVHALGFSHCMMQLLFFFSLSKLLKLNYSLELETVKESSGNCLNQLFISKRQIFFPELFIFDVKVGRGHGWKSSNCLQHLARECWRAARVDTDLGSPGKCVSREMQVSFCCVAGTSQSGALYRHKFRIECTELLFFYTVNVFFFVFSVCHD